MAGGSCTACSQFSPEFRGSGTLLQVTIGPRRRSLLDVILDAGRFDRSPSASAERPGAGVWTQPERSEGRPGAALLDTSPKHSEGRPGGASGLCPRRPGVRFGLVSAKTRRASGLCPSFPPSISTIKRSTWITGGSRAHPGSAAGPRYGGTREMPQRGRVPLPRTRRSGRRRSTYPPAGPQHGPRQRRLR